MMSARRHLIVAACLSMAPLACASHVNDTGWPESHSGQHPPAASMASAPLPAETTPPPGGPLSQGELEEYGLVAPPSSECGTAVSNCCTDETATGPEIGDTMGSSNRRYVAMRVHGDGTVSQFFYIRQDHFMRLFPATFDGGRLSAFGAFGPHPIDASVRALDGANYYFLPICGQRVARAQMLSRQAGKGRNIQLSCPR